MNPGLENDIILLKGKVVTSAPSDVYIFQSDQGVKFLPGWGTKIFTRPNAMRTFTRPSIARTWWWWRRRSWRYKK